MITEALLMTIYGILNILLYPLSFITDVTSLPSDITDTFVFIFQSFDLLNIFLNVYVFFGILIIFLTFEGVYLTYKSIRWVYQKLPFLH